MAIDPVDERLGWGPLAALGLQHVLAMYAGAVTVPLVVGRALQLTAEQVMMLISADLFCCGVVTLIQCLGVTRWVGVRLPVMMGVTFAAMGPMVTMAQARPGVEGARMIFGAIIAAGALATLMAPWIGRLRSWFPPLVTGTIIAVIGLSLMRVGLRWAQGNLSLSALVLMAILVTMRGKGFLSRVAVLVGIAIGSLVALVFGEMNAERVAQADWTAAVRPLAFGVPTFEVVPILTMTLVMVVVMVESTGMFLALAAMTGRELSPAALSAGLRADGVGTLLGGLFNTFPYTSYSQNVGLVALTGVPSRSVCVAGGGILMGLGLLPKVAAVAESIPLPVLGGAGVAMFGMVALTGIRMLGTVNLRARPSQWLVVAGGVGVGMMPQLMPWWSQQWPPSLRPLLDSGIVLATVTAVGLNAILTRRAA